MIHDLLRAKSRISDNLCYRSDLTSTTQHPLLHCCTGHALRILPVQPLHISGTRGGVTYWGLSHCRVLYFTPVPHVREQEPNLLHAPQCPSCFRMSGVSQMQWPLKQCWKRKSDVRMIRWLTCIRWEVVVPQIRILGTSSGFFFFTSPAESRGTCCQIVPMIPNSPRFYKLTCQYAHVCVQVLRPPSLLNCFQCYISSSPVCSGDMI